MPDDIRDIIDSRLHMVLEDLDEKAEGVLTEREAQLYFAVERYLYPDNEIFRPERLAATEREYMRRTERKPEIGVLRPLSEWLNGGD